MEGGFQYSNFGGEDSSQTSFTYNSYSSTTSSTKTYNGNLFGGDFQIGYKQFFGRTKRFGLRYYVFFSGQGGSATVTNSSYNASSYNQTFSYNQPSANLFYGAGIDMLFNFYDENEKTFGMVLGVMGGGSSWLMGKATYQNGTCVWGETNSGACQTMNQALLNSNDMGGNLLPIYGQFIVNIGFRGNFSKHQGIEFGVRVPTIDYPYYSCSQSYTVPPTTICGYSGCSESGSSSTDTGTETITFRRRVAVYVNYVINF
ncbi:outer membrane beta-barrel protein [Helicobacter suis]|uniref:outer membrane beta-barrel protein n=1 Tax=Helicobacter suis TaxID=104628 RepID=UPI0019673E21|nr:outer membrane beta-barrel protein [Helicobacter suis]